MSQTRDQQRFTISEVAADWHEPIVPQRIMWPSIARAQRTIGPTVQLADTLSPQSATLGLHPVARNLLHVTGNIVHVEQIHVAYPLYLSAVWTTFK